LSKTVAELIAKAEKNSKWLGRNYIRLTKKYSNEWVAVLDQRVFDHDPDLRILVAHTKKKLGRRYDEASIEYVTKEPVNMVLVIL